MEWQEAIAPDWRDRLLLYRRKYGPFNPMLRTDAAIARGVVGAVGGKMRDFMPWPRDEEEAFSPDVMVAKLKAVAMRNASRKVHGSA